MDPTFAEQMVTKIETILLGKADHDVLSYQIDGRSLSKYSFEELVVLRDRFKAEVAREQAAAQIAAGNGNPNKIKVRFV